MGLSEATIRPELWRRDAKPIVLDGAAALGIVRVDVDGGRLGVEGVLHEPGHGVVERGGEDGGLDLVGYLAGQGPYGHGPGYR